MGASGGTATRRTTAAGDDRSPTWAPSGSHIAFQSDRNGSAQLYTMTPTGSSQTRRTSNGAEDQVPSWQGDLTSPQTTIASGPPAVTNNPYANFAFTADEAGSGFECRLDGAAFQSCSSPFSSNPLGDGQHTFAVRAIDPSGNVDPSPATRTFEIDTTAKVSEITAGPSGPGNEPSPTFEFTSENETVTFECRIDFNPDAEPPVDPDSGWESCVSPHQVGPLADGDHRFEVRGTDGVGNVETDPQVRLFTIDTVAPETTITYEPDPLSSDDAPRAEFVSEPGSAFECRLSPSDGEPGSWQACESPWTPGELADGDYTLEVRATDPAGNPEAGVAEVSFTVDTKAPVTTITAGPGEAEEVTSVTFEFAADDPEATFECRLDGLDDADWTACTSPRTYENVNHGRHGFQVRATDLAGNTGIDPAESEFGVRNDPGHAITAKPDPLSADDEPAFEFSSLDPDTVYECRLDSNVESGWEPCLSPFAIPHAHFDPDTGEELTEQPHEGRLADGPHRFELRATDWFGEVTNLPAYEWTIATGPPGVTIVDGPDEVSNSDSATFEVQTGFGTNAVECSIDDSLWQPCGSPTPGADTRTIKYSGLFDQTHEFRVRAKSSLYPDFGEVASHHWTVDTHAPRVEIRTGLSARSASTSARFEIVANDPPPFPEPNEMKLWCRTDGTGGFDPSVGGPNAFRPCGSPVDLSGLAEGGHRFEVVATDRAGNSSPVVSRSWTIDLTGPEVTLIQAPPSSTTDTFARFAFGSTETGASFSCSLDDEPWRACGSPVDLASLAHGAHDFAVRATDSLGNVGAPVRHAWTVASQKPPVSRPGISFKRKARIKAGGSIRVATINCPSGTPCRVTAPKQTKIRVSGKTFKLKVKAPRRVAAGRSAAVSVVVPRRVRAAFRRQPVKLRLKLGVVTEAGGKRNLTRTVQLRR